jgi:hypothetical protein
MNRLGIPQDRIAKRLDLLPQQTISSHLPKMATLPNPVNADLSRGFTVAQVAEKHNWTEPMVWSLALEAEEDLERFKELGWGLRTWDVTVHTSWKPTGFCRVSTADKVAPKGVFSTDCALKPAKGCWLSGGK